MLIFVDKSNPSLTTRKGIWLLSLMTLVEKHGFIFWTEKSEAFVVFESFKIHVENETNLFIRALRIDRGGEFASQEFTNFCDVNGIRRQLIATYMPQQNRVAKWKNRTIMNMAHSIISKKKIPKTFWPEAVNWTVHVLNWSPTLVVKNKTPEDAWRSQAFNWAF